MRFENLPYLLFEYKKTIGVITKGHFLAWETSKGWKTLSGIEANHQTCMPWESNCDQKHLEISREWGIDPDEIDPIKMKIGNKSVYYVAFLDRGAFESPELRQISFKEAKEIELLDSEEKRLRQMKWFK